MAGPLTHAFRVRWGEVDAQGVVFNPNYFVYADVAVTECFRSTGILISGVEDLGQSYAVDARATFKASARFDDLLELKVWCPRIGRSSYELRVDILRDGLLLVEVHMTYVRAIDGKAEPLTDAFRDRLAMLAA